MADIDKAGQQADGKGMSRSAFLKSAAVLGLGASAGSLVNAGSALATPGPHPAPARLTYRGITYDTGTVFDATGTSRVLWNKRIIKRDIRAIAHELHCNVVNVVGGEVERLEQAAVEAAKRGLDVWIQPRFIDVPRATYMAQLVDVARMVQRLAHRFPCTKFTFNIGVELSIFGDGIMPGSNYLERIAYLQSHLPVPQQVQDNLNDFLTEAVGIARRYFSGDLTYGSTTFEQVNWAMFDVIGVDHYRAAGNRATYANLLIALKRRWNMRIAVTEFGCCAFDGGGELGPSGFFIVDPTSNPPTIREPVPARDEQEQADYITSVLDVLEDQSIYAAFVFEFIQPALPHSDVPTKDLDLAAFAIVRTIREDYDDPASHYHWEPKIAFQALAAHNKAASRRH